MKTFKHSTPKIRECSAYYGRVIVGYVPCENYKACKNTYTNIDDICGGLRIRAEGRIGEDCPCIGGVDEKGTRIVHINERIK